MYHFVSYLGVNVSINSLLQTHLKSFNRQHNAFAVVVIVFAVLFILQREIVKQLEVVT